MGDNDDAANDPPNRARLVLPPFEGGNGTTAMEARDFVDKCDSYATVARLSNEEIAQAVNFAVKKGSVAATWLRSLRQEDAAVAADWAQLKARFLARFCPSWTPAERAAAVGALKQNAHEDALSFLDRCRETQIMVEVDISAARRGTNPAVAAIAAAFKENHDACILDMFLRGLRTTNNFMKDVNSSPGCTTLEEFSAAAVRIEKYQPAHVQVVPIAAVAINDPEDPSAPKDGDSAEVAALKAHFRDQAARKPQRNGGAPAGANGAGGAPTPRLCWTCRSPDHLANRCPQGRQGQGGGRGGGGGRGRRNGQGNNGNGRRNNRQQKGGGQQQQQSNKSPDVNELLAHQMAKIILASQGRQVDSIGTQQQQQLQLQWPSHFH